MSNHKPIRIILADDHQLFRRGFRRIMEDQTEKEIVFIGEACNGLELVEIVNKLKPDLVITDIRMPGLDGIHACRMIKQKTHTPVIALSAFDDDSYIMDMVGAGANGYLSKNSTKEEVMEAIQSVSAGTPYYCSTVSDKLFGKTESSKHSFRKQAVFTPQETRVMQLVCKQFTIKEIAKLMSISTRTVESYRQHLQEKIGARNIVGVALYAIINGIVQMCEL
jgi:DNA-binding NarL/FixJ family response regulator